MRKNIFFTGVYLCALMLGVASCSNDDDADNWLTPDGKAIIKASVENSTVGGDGYAALDGVIHKWVAGNEIAVKVDGNAAENLQLNSDGTAASTKFGGVITPTGGDKMYAYYPAAAATADSSGRWVIVIGGYFEMESIEVATDLSTQTGKLEDAADNIVMFAEAPYSATPSFSFKNKVSILKLNMEVPADIAATDELYVKVIGACSIGTLTTDGKWIHTALEVIDVTDATITQDNKISAYVIVLPGSKLKNIRILVGGKCNDGTYKDYITEAYTQDTTVEENSMVTVSQALVSPKENYKASYTKEDFYQWDAYAPYDSGDTGHWGAGNESYNDTSFSYPIDWTRPDYATNQWTRNCPTFQQMCKMLYNGVKWVSGKPYTIDGKTCNTGIQMKKLVYCDISNLENSVELNTTIEDANYNGQYFFLPAAGSYGYDGNSQVGIMGVYWLSTPEDKDIVNFLIFGDIFYEDEYRRTASIAITDRYNSCLPLLVE